MRKYKLNVYFFRPKHDYSCQIQNLLLLTWHFFAEKINILFCEETLKNEL